MKGIRYFFFVFIFLLYLANISYSQWATDPSQNTPVCAAPNNQYNPHIVVDEKGNAIIVWEDISDPGGLSHIYAQRLNRYGYKLWDERGIPVCTARELKVIADVINDGQGGAIVVWLDYKDWFNPEPYEDSDIYTQRIDSSGVLLWDNDGVAVCTEKGDQYFWKVTKDDYGDVFIIWDDWRLSRPNVYMQRLNGDGVTLLPENGIKFLPEYSLYCSSVTDGLNGFFICFAEYYDATFHFYAQRIDSSGEKLWTNAVVLDHGGWAIADDVNDFLITNGKWAQRINKSGELLWGEHGIIFNEEFFELNSIELISDNSSGFYLTWRASTDTANLFISRMNESGEQLWTIFQHELALGWSINQGQHIVGDEKGNAIVKFERYLNDTLRYQFVQKVDADGNFVWGDSGIVYSYYNTKMTERLTGAMASDGFGGAILVWDDFLDIYAQQVSRNGNLGEVLTSVQSTKTELKTKQLYLSQNYPNPFNSSTKISYQIPEGGDVSLKIFNLNGQLVKTLISQKQNEEHYEIIWNGRDDNDHPVASGIYLYQLKINELVQTKKLTLI